MRKVFGCMAFLLAMGPAVAAPGENVASAAREARNEKGTHIVLLGTAGGPVLKADRSQPSSLLIVNGRNYLIDCGAGTLMRLRQAGLGPWETPTIFLTHLHMDHSADLANLIAYNWVSGDRSVQKIFGPAGTTELARAGVAYMAIAEALFSPQLPPHPDMAQVIDPLDIVAEKPTVIYKDENVTVTAVENSHYDTMKLPARSYGRDRSYSYRFDTADRSVVFSGDTGPSEALIELAKGADVLVAEVLDYEATLAAVRKLLKVPDEQLDALLRHNRDEHLSPEEIGKIAEAAKVKMVVLTHIVPGDASKAQMEKQFIGEIRKFFDGPVRVGGDLERF